MKELVVLDRLMNIWFFFEYSFVFILLAGKIFFLWGIFRLVFCLENFRLEFVVFKENLLEVDLVGVVDSLIVMFWGFFEERVWSFVCYFVGYKCF